VLAVVRRSVCTVTNTVEGVIDNAESTWKNRFVGRTKAAVSRKQSASRLYIGVKWRQAFERQHGYPAWVESGLGGGLHAIFQRAGHSTQRRPV